MQLYQDKSGDPKHNAQANLMGRTHYVDPDTLRWHKSRILETHVIDKGLLFALVESCAADMNNTRRVYRPVIFDLFGTVVERPKLEDSYKTRKQAVKAMWAALNNMAPKVLCLQAIERAENDFKREMHELRNTLEAL